MRSNQIIRLLFILLTFTLASPLVETRAFENQKEAPKSDVSQRGIDVIQKRYLRSVGSGAHCGVYCAANILRFYEIEVDVSSLLSNEYISSWEGSTAKDIVEIFEAYSVNAIVLKNLNVDYLRQKPEDQTIMLHLAQSRRVENTHHWIIYLGQKDGKAIICDPPRGIEQVDFAVLQTKWTGNAIVVSKNDISPGRIVATAYIPQIKWAALSGLFVLICTAWFRKRRNSFWAGLSSIFVLTVLFTALFHLVSKDGFCQNSAAVKLVEAKYTEADIPSIDSKGVRERIAKGWLVIDARLPLQFHQGHIANSINFPIDSSLGEIADLTEIASEKPKVVVYCQSKNCPWATTIGNQIYALTKNEVVWYEGGWNEWNSLEKERSNLEH